MLFSCTETKLRTSASHLLQYILIDCVLTLIGRADTLFSILKVVDVFTYLLFSPGVFFSGNSILLESLLNVVKIVECLSVWFRSLGDPIVGGVSLELGFTVVGFIVDVLGLLANDTLPEVLCSTVLRLLSSLNVRSLSMSNS